MTADRALGMRLLSVECQDADLERRARHGRRRRPARGSGLRLHLDGVARALLVAHRAAGAQVVVVAVEAARAELGDRLLGARRVAVVALEAVAAGQAAARLVARLGLGRGPATTSSKPLRSATGISPCCRRSASRKTGRLSDSKSTTACFGALSYAVAAQPGVDVARGLLAVADGGRHRARAADHVAAREHARVADAHPGVDLDHVAATDA